MNDAEQHVRLLRWKAIKRVREKDVIASRRVIKVALCM